MLLTRSRGQNATETALVGATQKTGNDSTGQAARTITDGEAEPVAVFPGERDQLTNCASKCTTVMKMNNRVWRGKVNNGLLWI